MTQGHTPTVNETAPLYDPALKKMTVRGATVFPLEILARADDIEILDMSFGHLSELPSEVARLRNLKIVFLSNNEFEEIPPVLADCPLLEMIGMKSCKISQLDPTSLPLSLKALILTDNRITAIPPSIGRLVNLQKLTLTGNLLTELPHELLQCPCLEFMRIAANQFSRLPTWILRHPALAWYSDAGNPGSQPGENLAGASIAWAQLNIEEELGRSPKNVVHKAFLGDQQRAVAVKLYGSDMTADGKTDDEIRACLVAGTHPNIITTIGELSDVPDGKRALVMEYVPSEYMALAQPPDFATLTRDVYGNGQIFTFSFVVTVLQGIAGALEHLHARGIMHGDMYAHNILVNQEGCAYLGDFGAAVLYSQAERGYECVEARAFALLGKELLGRCATDDAERAAYSQLEDALQKWARQPASFSEITRVLQNLHT